MEGGLGAAGHLEEGGIDYSGSLDGQGGRRRKEGREDEREEEGSWAARDLQQLILGGGLVSGAAPPACPSFPRG